MVFHKARNFALLIAATAAVLVSAGAYADDTEIFRGNPNNAAAPNILLILDTSGSMGSNTVSSPVAYDRNFTYAGTGDCSGIGIASTGRQATACRTATRTNGSTSAG